MASNSFEPQKTPQPAVNTPEAGPRKKKRTSTFNSAPLGPSRRYELPHTMLPGWQYRLLRG